ncbi:MAG: hypothetical protein RIB60_06090 [Phycisphaerales bacterium]
MAWYDSLQMMIDSTPITFLEGPDGVSTFLNDHSKRTNVLFPLRVGRGGEESVKTGRKLNLEVFRDGQKTGRTWRPGKKQDWSNPQTHTNLEVDWGLYIDEMAYNEFEFEFNDLQNPTAGQRADHFTSVEMKKQQRLANSMVDLIDDELLAVPDYDSMMSTSSNDDRRLVSILAAINEYGLPYDDGSASQWADFQTLTDWAATTNTYDVSAFEDPEDGLLTSLESTRDDLGFTGAPIMSNYFDDDETYRAMFILTSTAGRKKVKAAFRADGDRMSTVGQGDPTFGKPTVGGIPMWDHPTLDTVAAYRAASGNTLVSESGAAVAGPRYRFVNARYAEFFSHGGHFMRKRPSREPDGQVGYIVSPVTSCIQMLYSSDRRHGIVYPN